MKNVNKFEVGSKFWVSQKLMMKMPMISLWLSSSELMGVEQWKRQRQWVGGYWIETWCGQQFSRQSIMVFRRNLLFLYFLCKTREPAFQRYKIWHNFTNLRWKTLTNSRWDPNSEHFRSSWWRCRSYHSLWLSSSSELMGVGATFDVYSSSVGNHRCDFSTKWLFPIYIMQNITSLNKRQCVMICTQY